MLLLFFFYRLVNQPDQKQMFADALVNLRKEIISFVKFVRPSFFYPHGITRLLLEGFSLNLIFEHFSKIFPEISSFINPYPANVENRVRSSFLLPAWNNSAPTGQIFIEFDI